MQQNAGNNIGEKRGYRKGQETHTIELATGQSSAKVQAARVSVGEEESWKMIPPSTHCEKAEWYACDVDFSNFRQISTKMGGQTPAGRSST